MSFCTVPREKYRVKRRIRQLQNRVYIYSQSLSIHPPLAHTLDCMHTIFTEKIVPVFFSFSVCTREFDYIGCKYPQTLRRRRVRKKSRSE